MGASILYQTMRVLTAISVALLVTVCVADPIAEQDVTERDGKALPVFQVVKFPNDVCKGSTRNGTCYTAEECSTKGGASDGSCASGFGVCCMFALSCGGSAPENQTYLIQSSVTSLTSPCTYTICPCSTNICRIRYDFETFVLANQVAGTTVHGAVSITTRIEAIGDCTTDQFSISGLAGGGTGGSPVICGTNTGYHMIVDSAPGDTTCQKAQFNIGGSTSTSRTWSIRVTQYACGDYDSSGWPGCLQYYTATANTIQNFGFSPTATAVTSSVTHLSEQDYDICVRRASGMCYICYSPTITPGTPAVIVQVSFGVSLSDVAASKSDVGTTCIHDYLEIPGGNTAAISAIAIAAAINTNRYCGRFFNSVDAQTASATVCTRNQPFRVGVKFDGNEIHTAATASMAQLGEQSQFPGGITGFKLTYFQRSC